MKPSHHTTSARPGGSGRPIILASASPRRRRLLELVGIDFQVIASDVDESPEEGESPSGFARRAARDKAVDVAAHHADCCVLGADTVVEIDGRILGKPRGRDDARAMLRRLSGREHLVHTGMALVVAGAVTDIVDTARVRFIELDEDIAAWYANTGEPLDKAGAYAVQGAGGLLVSGIVGSPQTVIGLPIHRLPDLFAEHGIDFWRLLGGSQGPQPA